MATYDVLASHYDAVTGDPATEAQLIEDIIDRRHGRVTNLLDVACGTGAVTSLLSRAYQVSGLDISAGMLAVARDKLPEGTPLYVADMTSFRLSARFDAIVCAYQGVNHLLTLPAWKSFFRSVYWHLNSGGVFVFDIASLRYLVAMASIPKIVQQFGGHYLLMRVRTADGALFRWHIEVYQLQQDGKYTLLTQAIELTSFPVAQIREALGRWFIDVEIVAGDGSSADPDREDRIWLACAKP